MLKKAVASALLVVAAQAGILNGGAALASDPETTGRGERTSRGDNSSDGEKPGGEDGNRESGGTVQIIQPTGGASHDELISLLQAGAKWKPSATEDPVQLANMLRAGANWNVTEAENVEKVKKANAKLKVQIVVLTPQELASMGLKADGRVIYRVIEGVLQVIVTNPDDAKEVAGAFPDLTPLPTTSDPATLPTPKTTTETTENPPPDTTPKPTPFDTPDADPTPTPDNFDENPTQDNVSPS